ncbi:hypothetical protein [Streptomyces sp. NPDC002599]|uniref:hypothetical protein n=1 Tax=Streptomyces sp. NPDC002599 TaxID=3154421 RepID=UPI00331B3E5B
MTALEECDRPTARDCARILTGWADPAQLAIVPSSASALRFVPRRWFQCCGRRNPDRAGE